MRRIKVGVVGAGYLGKFHVQKYAELPNAELAAIVDTEKERADTLASSFHAEAFYSHIDIMERVDAVSIVTPTETHFDIAYEFLKRGIDVLLEKPMTDNIDEAEELIGMAKERGALLQVGHLERFNPAVAVLKDRRNDISPLFIESDRLSSFPNRGLDVDVVLDLMIHDIDIILNLVKSDFVSVEAVGVPVVSNKIDIANARLRFENGCIANVTASRVSGKALRKIRLFQPNEYISIDYSAQKIVILKKKRERGGRQEIVEEDINIKKNDSLKEELRSFLDCVATRREPLVSGRDGKKALKVAKEIQAAIKDSLNTIGGHVRL